MKNGMFELWTKSFAEIKCPMDYSLYPFDKQSCTFAMKSTNKNKTYEGRHKNKLEIMLGADDLNSISGLRN